MSKHTPGPWWTDAKYDGREMGCAIIAVCTHAGPPPGNPTRGIVAFARAVLNTEARQCEANARLIAAAPDFYDACLTLRNLEPLEDAEDEDVIVISVKTLRDIRAAIAKAEGRT